MLHYSSTSNPTKLLTRANLIDRHINRVGQESEYTYLLPELDNFTFKRKADVELTTVTGKVLCDIRSRSSKMRLWLSGGVDSAFVLRQCLLNEIQLDEIHVVQKTPFDDFLISALDEATSGAMDLLQQDWVADKLTGTKIFLNRVTPGHCESTYSQSKFWETTCDHSLCLPAYVCNFQKYFNINNSETECSLTGIETPYIYYNDGWKFFFYDKQVYSDYSEDVHPAHNISFRDPIFLEAYVNSIINILETFRDYKSRFTLDKIKSVYCGNKYFRSIVPEMQQTNGMLWGVNHGKFTNFRLFHEFPEFSELVGNSTMRSALMYNSPHIKTQSWFNMWKNNTDWDWVKASFNFPGIQTKNYSIT